MLAGILKSDVAVTASLKIVDIFIAMKQYMSSNLIKQKYYNNMINKHDSEIKLLQESFDKLQNEYIISIEDKLVKNNLLKYVIEILKK